MVPPRNDYTDRVAALIVRKSNLHRVVRLRHQVSEEATGVSPLFEGESRVSGAFREVPDSRDDPAIRRAIALYKKRLVVAKRRVTEMEIARSVLHVIRPSGTFDQCILRALHGRSRDGFFQTHAHVSRGFSRQNLSGKSRYDLVRFVAPRHSPDDH